MKNRTRVFMALLCALAAAAPCSQGAEEQSRTNRPAPAASIVTGTVVETMNSGGYTYVQVDTGVEKVWAAAPTCPIKTGEKVTVPLTMPMENFSSKTLNRTFDVIYFAQTIKSARSGAAAAQLPAGHPEIPGASPALPAGHPALPAGHPSVSGMTNATPMDVSGIVKPPDGKTIAEIRAERGALAGKTVIVRGKVVKFTPAVMSKNWLHLRDGSGSDKLSELTITTDATAKVGDLLLVTGVLATNRNFGFGYQYDVIVEDAKIKVE